MANPTEKCITKIVKSRMKIFIKGNTGYLYPVLKWFAVKKSDVWNTRWIIVQGFQIWAVCLVLTALVSVNPNITDKFYQVLCRWKHFRLWMRRKKSYQNGDYIRMTNFFSFNVYVFSSKIKHDCKKVNCFRGQRKNGISGKWSSFAILTIVQWNHFYNFFFW